MRKNIIISGVQGSGKSHIARAIALTHQSSLTIFPKRILSDIQQLEIKQRIKAIDLIIIEECSLDNIIKIKSSLSKIKDITLPSIVFLTQEHVSPRIIDFKDYHIINCKNLIF